MHLQGCGSGDLHCSKGSHPGLQVAFVTGDGPGVGLFSELLTIGRGGVSQLAPLVSPVQVDCK